jgi:hypothetical protein
MRPIVGALRGIQMTGRSNPVRSNACWVRVLLKVKILGRLAADVLHNFGGLFSGTYVGFRLRPLSKRPRNFNLILAACKRVI